MTKIITDNVERSHLSLYSVQKSLVQEHTALFVTIDN